MGADSRECADCGKVPPHTETAYTLISPKHAWRLSRRPGPDGGVIVEWRCPECWRKYKDTIGSTGSSSSSIGASNPLSSSKFAAVTSHGTGQGTSIGSSSGESSSRIKIEPAPLSERPGPVRDARGGTRRP